MHFVMFSQNDVSHVEGLEVQHPHHNASSEASSNTPTYRRPDGHQVLQARKIPGFSPMHQPLKAEIPRNSLAGFVYRLQDSIANHRPRSCKP